MLRLPIVASILASALGFGTLGTVASPAMAAPSQITGTVFEDFNSDGVQDTTSTISNSGSGTVGVAVDRGMSGVTATAFDNAGNAVGSAISGLDGTYAINIAVPNDGPYRVEFSTLPAGYQPSFAGPGDQTSVQFVPDGNTAGVNFGILLPAKYCQDNPTLVTCLYRFGNQINGDNNALSTMVSFPYAAGSDGTTLADIPAYDVPAPTTVVVANQTGPTWGLAYARGTRRLFAAAFMKKHAGFGAGEDGIANTPDDAGAIYVINPTTNAVVDVFTVPGATTNPARDRRHTVHHR